MASRSSTHAETRLLRDVLDQTVAALRKPGVDEQVVTGSAPSCVKDALLLSGPSGLHDRSAPYSRAPGSLNAAPEGGVTLRLVAPPDYPDAA